MDGWKTIVCLFSGAMECKIWIRKIARYPSFLSVGCILGIAPSPSLPIMVRDFRGAQAPNRSAPFQGPVRSSHRTQEGKLYRLPTNHPFFGANLLLVSRVNLGPA